jgi:hypothetical protein
MTTSFLMKIGEEYFFKLVRYIFFISILAVVREITYWKTVDRILLIIGCWLTLLFFVFPADRPINFPEKVCLLCWI